MTTLTDPGYNLLSLPTGMILPVPIRLIGTTGTPVFAAILNAPFYKSPKQKQNSLSIIYPKGKKQILPPSQLVQFPFRDVTNR